MNDVNKNKAKEFLSEFSNLDDVFTNQLLRYKLSFKVLVFVFILSIAISLLSVIYMFSVVKTAINEINKRPYLVLSDRVFLGTKANVNLEEYIRTNIMNIASNLLTVVPKSGNTNLQYITSYTNSTDIVTTYKKWLENKLYFLNTINGIMLFIPDKDSFVVQINNNSLNSGGDLSFLCKIEGDVYTISNRENKKSRYVINFAVRVNDTHKGVNQIGFDIYTIQINEIGG